MRERLRLWVLALSVAIATLNVEAHEIPTDVTIRVIVHPTGSRLHLLVRVPLEAMMDTQFPLRGPGLLDIEAVPPVAEQAARRWLAGSVTVYEDGRALPEPAIGALRISLPSDRSFTDYSAALGHLRGPTLPADVQLPWRQAMLDALFEYPIGSAESEFGIESSLARLGLRTTTSLLFVAADGSERPYQFRGDPGRVHLDPRWYQAVLSFIGLGFWHILDGIDHLLFLLCLIVPYRRIWPLVPVVTSFTVAHSITLIASAFGLAPNALWFPPLIESLIALSIVYMALENIVGPKTGHRWMIAFGFGLVHGFGFSFLLRESMQFAGAHLLTSLLAFNVGVEIGQLLVLVVVVPALALLFRRVVAERMGIILLSALVAHSAWHWLTERGSQLLEYQFHWPLLDAVLLAAVGRWVLLGAITVGALWLLETLFGRLLPGAVSGQETAERR